MVMGWIQSLLAKWRKREAVRFPAGLAAWNTYVRDTLAEVSHAREPDWTVLLHEARLPHGGVRWIRADVSATEPARILVSVRAFSTAGERSSSLMGAPVSTQAVHEGTALAGMIREAIAQRNRSSKGPSPGIGDTQPVKDGHRCILVVIGGEKIRLRQEIPLWPGEAPLGAIARLGATVVALADRSA